jgi:hypothetical protein
MALSLASAVKSSNSDFLDEQSVLSGLARQKLFMITKPGSNVVKLFTDVVYEFS